MGRKGKYNHKNKLRKYVDVSHEKYKEQRRQKLKERNECGEMG